MSMEKMARTKETAREKDEILQNTMDSKAISKILVKILKSEGLRYTDQRQAIWDENNKALRMAGSIRDISNIKKAENQIMKKHSTMKKEIQEATKFAIDIPLKIMETALNSMEVINAMAKEGNPNSITDTAVGASLCASGNHVCNGTIGNFTANPTNKNAKTTFLKHRDF